MQIVKVAVSLPRGGCSVALVVLVGLDLQFAIIMYWNDTAWMAIKSTHPRYSLDDGKTQHTRLQWL